MTHLAMKAIGHLASSVLILFEGNRGFFRGGSRYAAHSQWLQAIIISSQRPLLGLAFPACKAISDIVPFASCMTACLDGHIFLQLP